MTMAVVLRGAAAMAVLYAAWLLMQLVHELGHVAGAVATGGRVERVVLHPLGISRTDVRPNPRPLVVVWAGPIVGVALPCLIALATPHRVPRVRRLTAFFAGFCLIANGLYIGGGSFTAIGDAGDAIRHGSPQWVLIVFGIVCTAAGLAVWHVLTKRP